MITLEIMGKSLLLFFCIYAILPQIITSTFGFGVFRQADTKCEVAFTFDDGPDKGYTPRLLDLLKEYNVKATFFVLGVKAEKFPELILRIHQEGHLIGIHNYDHWANSLMTPWKVRGQINRSATIIEKITGKRPVYYRPPWGLMNVFDFILHKKLRIVMWSLMVGDWRSRGGKERIRTKLLKSVKAGDVIVLHDSGDTIGAEKSAPLHMIEALEEVLKEVVKQGYRFVRIDEMIDLDG
ncbi:MAG: polysaccharide deacetylase family protein, partial [Bacilli bacterium]